MKKHMLQKSIAASTNPNNWVKRTYGMMAEAWKDIDPIAELEKMRDEWEENQEKSGKRRQTQTFQKIACCFVKQCIEPVSLLLPICTCTTFDLYSILLGIHRDVRCR